MGSEKWERSIGSFLFQLCRYGGRFSKRGQLFTFALNDGRQSRSPRIFAALFSHLDNGPTERGADSRQRFVSPRRVCPPAITASTRRTQRELFQGKSGAAAKYYWRSSRSGDFLSGRSDMRSDVFATKKGGLPDIVFRQCTRLTFLARSKVGL